MTKFYPKNELFFCKACHIFLLTPANKGLWLSAKIKGDDMQTKRGGYRGKPKPKLPPHLKRVRVNVRIQRWMLGQLKEKGEIGVVLEDILKNAGFKYREPGND